MCNEREQSVQSFVDPSRHCCTFTISLLEIGFWGENIFGKNVTKFAPMCEDLKRLFCKIW